MLRDDVLSMLKKEESPLSGEEMSRTLGVSRAAVWKAIETLRQEGYEIASAPNRGYRLTHSPDRISAGELSGALGGRIIGRELVCLESVDSTNSEVKRLALSGAADGLAVLADKQTGGRGRMGRSFLSPAGKGLYFSVLLRPACSLGELMGLTAWTAVAVCSGIETACGVRPGIKWTNDLILGGKKVCGILTELGMEGESAQVQYAVVGVGINVSQSAEDFGAELSPIAVSLKGALGSSPRRAELAAAVLSALDDMYRAFPRKQEEYLEQYRRDCLTLGCRVQVKHPAGNWEGTAEALRDDFALLIRRDDGALIPVNSGEVSIRSLPGQAF